MKLWIVFVVLTILCWGAYVPTLHHGQMALGKNSALRAFLFVGLAYGIVSVAVLAYLWMAKAEPWDFNAAGSTMSTVAGILGAIGALGIVFAMKNGGKPIIVAPLVFAGAPIMNTFVSMVWARSVEMPKPWFYIGIGLAGVGAAMALYNKPAEKKPATVLGEPVTMAAAADSTAAPAPASRGSD